jgi:prepilin-type processing-associated H-X9-DG protein
MSKLKTGIIGAIVVAGLAIPLVFQNQALNKSREENDSLKQQMAQAAQLASENERLSNVLAQAKSAANENQSAELLRLRSEVGTLRRQTNEAAKLQQENLRLKDALANAAHAAAANPGAGAAQDDAARQQEMAVAHARMNDAKNLVLGMLLFSQAHPGQAPGSLDDAKSYVADRLSQSNEFDLVYSGPMQSVTNPATTIVIRERQAQQASNGKWSKTYGFADGHVEIHSEPDGNFDPWEQQHLVPAPPVAQPGQ